MAPAGEVFPLRLALSNPVSLFGCSPSASLRTPSQGRACSVGGVAPTIRPCFLPSLRGRAKHCLDTGGWSGVNLARKFPFHEKQPYPLDRRRTRKRRNAPPKRPPTLHAGGAAPFHGHLAVGVTRRYTLRYTLSYRLKLHLAPLYAGCSVRSGEVAEEPPGRTVASEWRSRLKTHSPQVLLPRRAT